MSTPIFYCPEYVLAEYSFDTTRKSMWIAESLRHDPVEGVELRRPAFLSREQIERVHASGYVSAVESGNPLHLASSQGFRWDPGLWTMVSASNGGMLDAALYALRHGGVAGSLSSGLHHARYEYGAGFCTFNGLVLAAQAALEQGANSVLIIDFDAHCGGGTASLIEGDPHIFQVDVSTSGYDYYENSQNCSLELVSSAEEYLKQVERMLVTAEQAGPFSLCLYNAGMDPYENCATGGLRGITRKVLKERERMVFQWAFSQQLPIAFALAGGYTGDSLDENDLVGLHRLTIEAAAKDINKRV